MTTAAKSQNQAGNRIEERSQESKWSDISFLWITRIFAFGVAAVLIFIGVEVAIDAWPAIQEYGLEFLYTSAWNPVAGDYGAWPMIYGTLVSSFIALLLAVPIGVGTAVFLSEDFLPPPVRTVAAFMVELLAAIPSVVYGLWGIFILIPFLQPIGNWLHSNLGWIPLFRTQYIGPGMFPAALILTVMILPIITAISRDSLLSLPPHLRQAAFGMGATRWTAIFRVLIPAAFSGIVGGTMLARVLDLKMREAEIRRQSRAFLAHLVTSLRGGFTTEISGEQWQDVRDMLTEVTTYRVDLSSHAPPGNGTDAGSEDCAGEVAYRLNLTVDYREAMRVAVYEEGEVTSGGGGDPTEGDVS